MVAVAAGAGPGVDANYCTAGMGAAEQVRGAEQHALPDQAGRDQNTPRSHQVRAGPLAIRDNI